MPPVTPQAPPIPVALVYWGRLGAGAALLAQIEAALAADSRFDLFHSQSRQSEIPIEGRDAAHAFPIDTFSGPLSLIGRSLILPIAIDRLVGRLSAAEIRAIVTVMPHVWGLALQRAARKAGIRTILIVHDADSHPGERRPVFDRLVRREIRASDRIVTLSDHVADRLLARGDLDEARLSRLYHPIFFFPPRDAPGSHPQRPFRLLFFGRILPYKGVPLLLEAFAALRAAGVNCTLRIAGRGEIDAPPALLTQPGLTIEQGWIAPGNIGDVLASADAIVLPYTEASQSGVIAAAYGAGLPVVATPVGGLAEQVRDGKTGVLAEAVGAAALAAAIRRLVETPGLYEACRAGVADYVAAHAPERFATALGDAVLAALNAPLHN